VKVNGTGPKVRKVVLSLTSTPIMSILPPSSPVLATVRKRLSSPLEYLWILKKTDTSVSWISTRSRHLNLLPKRHRKLRSGHPAR